MSTKTAAKPPPRMDRAPRTLAVFEWAPWDRPPRRAYRARVQRVRFDRAGDRDAAAIATRCRCMTTADWQSGRPASSYGSPRSSAWRWRGFGEYGRNNFAVRASAATGAGRPTARPC
jgi:hypothetical protein